MPGLVWVYSLLLQKVFEPYSIHKWLKPLIKSPPNCEAKSHFSTRITHQLIIHLTDRYSVPTKCGGGNGNPLQILAWKIPWTEEPGGLQSRGLQRVGHDWAYVLGQTHTHTHTHPYWMTGYFGGRVVLYGWFKRKCKQISFRVKLLKSE